MNQIIRTLIVDDSAFVRKAVREMLSRSPYIDVVGSARNGEEALQMTVELKPDVITCDLTMPVLDGIGFVRRQMATHPLPILILTASSQDDERALEALEAGAVDLVQKPTALASDALLDIREQLINKVKAASRVHAGKLRPEATAAPTASFTPRTLKADVVVLGISTGGPQALRYLIPRLPAGFPVPMALVLHMPVGYTRLFAGKLDEISALDVKEAAEGDEMKSGTVLVAQAGRHLVLRKSASGRVVAQLAVQPLEALHRPSVDVLFQSAAEIYRDRVLGVVMTGMGNDGKQGAAWIKAQGGSILTEAEESCVIYGMPRSVADAGLSDAAIPLEGMAQAIMERI